MSNRLYVKVPKTISLPDSSTKKRKINNVVWKNNIFSHLLNFYKNYNPLEIRSIISDGGKIEDNIASHIRIKLKISRKFNLQGFIIHGGVNNDNETKKGLYDITISHSDWRNIDNSLCEFHFECKNLDNSTTLIKKYIYYNEKECGVYRFFNGKYAQDQTFGGMIGFVLSGNVLDIKKKIHQKLNDKYDITPEGDLKELIDNSIEENHFTFNSIHNRKNQGFTLHHLLFDFN
jgi:hypothetical protein